MKEVYTLEDLEDRALLDQGAEKPALLAVIGHPITQSRSPQMQQSVLDEEGKNIRYIRLDIDPENIPETLKRLYYLGFIGCNITIPHKQQAFDLIPPKDELSKRIEAINTIRFPEHKAGIKAFSFQECTSMNTDAPGFLSAYQSEFNDSLEGKKVVILGAGGGAGTAIAYACAKVKCAQLTLVNRTLSKIEPLVQALKLEYDAHVSALSSDFSPALRSVIESANVIIQASSLGLNEDDPLPMPEEWLCPHHTVIDIITHETPLLNAAKKKGLRSMDGLPMLIHQGALSYQFWFGHLPYVDTMTRALRLDYHG